MLLALFQRVLGVENLGSVPSQKDLGVSHISELITNVLNVQVKSNHVTNTMNVALGLGDVVVHGSVLSG